MIDRDLVRILRIEIDAALREVARVHGLDIACCNARFNATQVNFKLECKPRATAVEADNEAREHFERWAPALELDPAWYGQRIRIHDHDFIVAGLAPHRTKNSVQIRRCADDKGFVCAPSVLVKQLTRVAVSPLGA